MVYEKTDLIGQKADFLYDPTRKMNNDEQAFYKGICVGGYKLLFILNADKPNIELVSDRMAKYCEIVRDSEGVNIMAHVHSEKPIAFYFVPDGSKLDIAEMTAYLNIEVKPLLLGAAN